MNPSGDGIRVVHPLFQAEGSGSTPTSPLQLHVGWTTVQVAIGLNELWHSRLPKFTYPPEKCKALCAEFDGVFYAAAIWSPPVARMLNNTGRYELRRFAIAPDAPQNTASRMLRIMRVLIERKMPEVCTLISYQDTEVHTGAIYRAAGWRPVVASAGGEWVRKNRTSGVAQSAAPKVRWELQIRDADNESAQCFSTEGEKSR